MKRDITVELVELDETHTEPCCFCSTPEHDSLLRERGVVGAEYRMENTYGATLGYTCGMCVEAGTRPEGSS